MNLQKWGDEALSNAITYSAWKAITASGSGKSARSHFRSFELTDDTVLVYLWFDFDHS